MKCPRCGLNKTLYDPFRGEYFCGNCGLVLAKEAVVIPQQIEATLFLGSYTDFNGSRLSSINKRILADITRFGNGKYQREKAYAIAEIFRINAVLHLPPIVRYQSLQIYEYVITESSIVMDKRITLESLATAVVMEAMEILGFHRDFDEITNVSKAKVENIEVSFEKVKQKWEEHVRDKLNNARPCDGAPLKKSRGVEE